MSAILETRQLTKTFGAFSAVKDISLSFQKGMIHAVLGENGAGKSTLMKLLFGLHSPTSGEIVLDGKSVVWRDSMDAIRNGLGMVQQHFSLVEPMSAIDNIMLGAEVAGPFGQLRRKQAIELIESLLPSPMLAVPWETKVQDLSVGFRQRVEILKLLFRDARVLFLDEPTAVLTPQEVQDFFSVLRALRDEGRTIILITHKIAEVFSLCDTYTVLRRGEVTAKGLVSETTPEALVESMIGRKVGDLPQSRTKAKDDLVIEADNVSQTESGRGVLKSVSLNVRAGEIVGIAGVEGSGQSQFVDALIGLKSVNGKLAVMGSSVNEGSTKQVRNAGVGLVPEDRNVQGLWGDVSCIQNSIIGLEDEFLKNGIFNDSKVREAALEWTKGFDVRTSSLENSANSLSGGNQQKLIFSREVSGRKPKLLICHQPTRGVDLGAIELIHTSLLQLREKGLGILVLSSELDELLALCDRLYVFFEGRTVAEFARNDFDRLKIGRAMTGAHDA